MFNQSFSRRKFIRNLSIATAAASSSYSAGVFSLPKKRKIGVALVGLGYYSRDLLAPALLLTEHCELKGVVTGSPEKIPAWQKKYGVESKNVYNYKNMRTVANNPDIDVIYIVLPTSMHRKYVEIAANAGKHVWCEKPMAMTEQDCQAMINVCKKNKVQLTVGYRMQHEPNTQTVIQYAKHKPFGKIKNVIAKAGYKGNGETPGHWRMKKNMGGGAMYDMGVYPLNAARYATGEEPIAVTASHVIARPEIFKDVDETTYFNLEFPSGAAATCSASVGINFNRLQVNCEKAWYELVPMQAYNNVKGQTSTGILLNKNVANQQAQQMDDDALAIINNTPVLVPGEEGLKDIRAIEAISKAAITGKKVNI